MKQIKSTTIKSLASILVLLFIPCMLYALPPTANYQGYLTNKKDGTPIDGSVDMTFSFFVDETSETPVWTEEHFSVPVNKGSFSVKLGSQDSEDLSESLTADQEIYVSISIAGEEMEGRAKLDSVIKSIFSIYSTMAESVAQNSIRSENIVNGSITFSDIEPGSLTSSNIAPGAIKDVNIATGALNYEHFSDLLKQKLNIDDTGVTGSETIKLIAGEVINGEQTPVPVYLSKDTMILEQPEYPSGTQVFGVNTFAQTFRTDPETFDIKKIELYLKKEGNPSEDIEIIISNLVEGKPSDETADQVASITISSAEIINDWNMIELKSPVNVSPSTDYAIIVRISNADDEDHVIWGHTNSDVYNQGCRFSSIDFGRTFSASADTDFAFRLYSYHRIFICKADDPDKLGISGLVNQNVSPGDEVIVQYRGIVNGFNGLIEGFNYYIQDDGTIGLQPGTIKKMIGQAVSPNSLRIIWSDSLDYATKEEVEKGVDNTKIMTPADVESKVTPLSEKIQKKYQYGENISGGAKPVPVYMAYDSSIDAPLISQTYYSTSTNFYNSTWYAQSFTTGEYTNRITEISLYLSKSNNPSGKFYVSIYDTYGDKPNTSLATIEIDLSGDIITSNFQIIPFKFEVPVRVVPNTRYAIVAKATNTGASDRYVNWYYYYNNSSDNKYQDGYPLRSTNSGSSWSQWGNNGYDFYFSVNGLVGNGTEGDEKIYSCEANKNSKVMFMGFATETKNADELGYVQFSGLVEDFSGLQPGWKYYVQNSKGEIGPTPGTNNILCGKAISPTSLLILHP